MAESKKNKTAGKDAVAQFYPGKEYIKLATAYVPPQWFRESFTLSEALSKGTLFPELYMPYRYRDPL
ncbi:MAG: spore coat associated protein CotJA [Thermacetogeniaceae bacterium]